MDRKSLVKLAVLALLFAATCLWAYWPGLKGDFLFDDYANLPVLGSGGPITHWSTFWRYITSGQADPTGRPLALLSFLLDARDWPAAALPFKRTNLILHLLNGVLVFWLLDRLGRAGSQDDSPHAAARLRLAAVLGAGFWLIHPLFVSSVLYVIQREALLSSGFVLLGLVLWLRGRHACIAGRPMAGIGWLLAGLGACTALATLSKANGLLLPPLALLLEYTWPWRDRSDHEVGGASTRTAAASRYRMAMAVMAGVPTLLLATYLAKAGIEGIAHGIGALRPWTLGQRLLTEPRVVLDYLRLLWLPRPFTAGLFNDQFAFSTSVWSPAGTLPAIAAVAGLIVGACVLRKRRPAVAVALLFYFVGQSMESTTVPLELYFEHRNYLPAVLMFWPLALWISGASLRPKAGLGDTVHARPDPFYRRPSFRWLVAAAIGATLVLMTHARATLWGNQQQQAVLWATLNPQSPRAQANAAMAETAAGHPERAAERLAPLLARQPDQVQLALNLLSARCAMGHLDAATLRAARQALRSTRDTGTLLASWFGRAIDQRDQPVCPELTLDAVANLLDAALANPILVSEAGRRQDLYSLRGRIALARGESQAALDDFNRALDQDIRPTTAFQQAALLGTAGYPELALRHLDHYQAEADHVHALPPGMPRIHAWVLSKQRYWEKELAHLRNTLEGDVTARHQRDP